MIANQQTPEEPRRALIVAAIQCEFLAVVAHLSRCEEVVEPKGTVYEVGEFEDNGRAWSVAVAECGAGNANAADIVHLVVQHFEPHVLLFAGVAGSLKEDVRLGDVVASSKVYGYHSGKSEHEFRPRPMVALPQHGLDQRARATARRPAWKRRIKRTSPDPPCDPSATVGAIAAGEEVVAGTESTTYQLIKLNYGDAQVVEMEGYGILRSAHVLGIPAIVIRSASDNVHDKGKCDGEGWQPVAAAHAAAFAFEMLANLDLGVARQRFVPGSTPPGSADGEGTPLSPGPPGGVKLGRTLSERPSAEQIIESFRRASTPLLEWPSELGPGERLSRPELRQIEDQLGSGVGDQVVLVLGAAGVGKSTLLSRLAQAQLAAGVAVLGIKADMLLPSVDSQAALAEALELPADLAECVRAVAAEQRVVILLDQLDALADLVDLKSGRLNVLLDVVQELRDVPNVAVVSSCRAFERNHDARLRTLEAVTIELAPPPWDAVVEVLKGRGIEGASWPTEFRDLLQVPQHLKVFLDRLEESGESAVFGSYQEMLEDLWRRLIDPSPERTQLVDDLAAYLAEHEAFWAPLVRYELSTVDALVALGVLARSGSGGARVGFRHQTLFEHARARAFARDGVSLADYVQHRQDSLFIRPLLWMTLRYLRQAAPAEYARELDQLFRAAPRLHVRMLLVDFLGQCPSPEPFEVAWLATNLNDANLRPRAVAAIVGNASWFSALLANQLPALMALPAEAAAPMIAVLAAAGRFAADEALALVEHYWLPDSQKDRLTLNALVELNRWDDRTVDWLCRIVRRSQLAIAEVMWLVSHLREVPVLAAKLVGTKLNQLLQEAKQPARPPVTASPDGTIAELLDARLEAAGQDPFVRLLDPSNRWYGLAELAEAEPQAFLDQVWPWLMQVLEHLEEPASRWRLEYRPVYAGAMAFDRSVRGDYALAEAIDAAVQALAKLPGNEFLELADRAQASENIVVQRLLARGFRAAADRKPHAALDFLLSDPRRLALGDGQDPLGDSERLVSALSPNLQETDCARLEKYLLLWRRRSVEKPDGSELGDQTAVWNEQDSAQLLAAMTPDRLSATALAIVDRHRTTLLAERKSRANELVMIGSPVSLEEMTAFSDAELLQLFRELTDDTESSHPQDFLRGGSVQASREFRELAQQQPERISSLLRQFQPGTQERPVGEALSGLMEAGMPLESLLELIQDLDRLGFHTALFRVEACQLLAKAFRNRQGLEDQVCEMLERWLRSTPDSSSDYGERGDAKVEGPPRSILWGTGGSEPLPYGRYFILHALTYGYLLRDPPAYDRWLDMLDKHLEFEETAANWRAFAHEMRWLRNCDATRATGILTRLFAAYPDVLGSRQGAVLLAEVRMKIAAESLERMLNDLSDGEWPRSRQAYGELLGLIAIVTGAHAWARLDIARLLERAKSDEPPPEEVFVGLAFAAARLWNEPVARVSAHQILVPLAQLPSAEVGDALMDVFLTTESLPADEATRTLLNAIAENPQMLASSKTDYLVNHLVDLVVYEPETVWRICERLVALRGNELRSIQFSLYACTPDLLSVALTLQRLGGPWRARGLDLFERLLQLELPDARAAVDQLDRRLDKALPRAPLQRRRKRAPKTTEYSSGVSGAGGRQDQRLPWFR